MHSRPSPATVLEVGCSSGFFLRELQARLPGHLILGSDYRRGTLETLAKRVSNIPLTQFDLTRCPLPDNFTDVVVLLNVLERIEDHKAAIASYFGSYVRAAPLSSRSPQAPTSTTSMIAC